MLDDIAWLVDLFHLKWLDGVEVKALPSLVLYHHTENTVTVHTLVGWITVMLN